MKTFVIGDIHGAYKALIQCIEYSGFDKEKDTLITLGDIADSFPEVSKCVDELLTVKNHINIRGNHDVWLNDWLHYGTTPVIWTEQGGKASIKSYIDSGKLADETHKEFFRNQIDYYIDDKNRLFVHSGFPKEGFECAKTTKVNAGNGALKLHWDRDLWECAELKTVSLAYKDKKSWFTEFDEIFIGHTAIKPENFKKYQNVWNLDTGAGWNGKLTIMDIDTKEFWQSDFVINLYSNAI